MEVTILPSIRTRLVLAAIRTQTVLLVVLCILCILHMHALLFVSGGAQAQGAAAYCYSQGFINSQPVNTMLPVLACTAAFAHTTWWVWSILDNEAPTFAKYGLIQLVMQVGLIVITLITSLVVQFSKSKVVRYVTSAIWLVYLFVTLSLQVFTTAHIKREL